MTQAVSNNLNNLQEMVSQVNQVSNKITETTKTADVVSTEKVSDKLVDFSKVLEKQVAKDDVKTIADLKNGNFVDQAETDWANFREVLSQITGEKNIETSLDLTLARDINEIISQLKEAIDETVDETEDLVEKTEVVEEITTELVSEDDEAVIDDVIAEVVPEIEVDVNVEKDDVEIQKSEIPVHTELVDAQLLNKELTAKTEKVDFSEEVKPLNDFTESSVDSEMFNHLNNLTADDTAKADETTQNEVEINIDEDVLRDLNIESISAEADTSEQNLLMNSQTPQEQGVKAMLQAEIETFDLNIDRAMKTNEAPQAQIQQPKVVDVNPSKILDQITKQMEALQNNSKVNIVLNPESLGKVSIQLIKTGEGLSAQFTVANQEVRDMLMKGLDGLRDSLTSHGVGVDNVSVKLNESQKSEYNADWTEQEDSRGGNKEQGRSNKDEKEKGLFEQMMAQTLEEENGNV